MTNISTMVEHYMAQEEEARLGRSGHGRLEQIRTRELLTRYLPAPPAHILDIGGGTGLYAAWLAEQSYAVHLIDPVPRHVERARAYGTFTAAEGDARALAEPDNSADAVLLLGPLYHLLEREDRLRALGEARRVLRPGGVVAAATIGRYMALLAYCARGSLTPERLPLLLPTLQNGRHDPALDFTDAYFHRPEELAEEMRLAGFEAVRILGIEGPAWIAVDAAEADDERYLKSALLCARAVEEDAAMLPMSAHLLAIGRAPQTAA